MTMTPAGSFVESLLLPFIVVEFISVAVCVLSDRVFDAHWLGFLLCPVDRRECVCVGRLERIAHRLVFVCDGWLSRSASFADWRPDDRRTAWRACSRSCRAHCSSKRLQSSACLCTGSGSVGGAAAGVDHCARGSVVCRRWRVDVAHRWIGDVAGNSQWRSWRKCFTRVVSQSKRAARSRVGVGVVGLRRLLSILFHAPTSSPECGHSPTMAVRLARASRFCFSRSVRCLADCGRRGSMSSGVEVLSIEC
jgi:hypothetical protein